jgi:hypothetical protein
VAGGDVTPPLTAAGSDPPPSNTAVLSATVDSTVDSSSVDVLAPAVSGTAGAAVAGVVISEGVVPEAAVADPGKPSVANASTSGRPAEVLGVRYERSAPSTLARTGVDLVAFAGAGVLLCLGGAGLLSVRSRRDTVSVAARLAGYGIAA